MHSNQYIFFYILLLFLTSCATHTHNTPARNQARPNVLMIAVDDLNHWVSHLGRNPQAITPNIDRLAARGMSFHRAYAPSAICNATRAAMMSGMRPSTTGIYENNIHWRSVIGEGYTLPNFFREQGYYVAGGGKIFHNNSYRESEWESYYSHKSRKQLEGTDAKAKQQGKSLSYKASILPIEEFAGGDDTVIDYHVAKWAAKELSKKHTRPFFIAAGIFRPHLPWAVPKKYFDLYPEEDIQLPPYNANDLDDLPNDNKIDPIHAQILAENSWKKAIRAYLASITYADIQVGRILDALDKSRYRDNTIVVLWGDHGWHLGEKLRWRKFALWEEATRTPYIWVAPGVTKAGSKTDTAVDLQSLWPTLAALVGAPLPQHVEGQSILELLDDPDAPWTIPALTTQGFNNHAIRSTRYRYIKYNRGTKEFYDHANDPYEWTNLAENQASAAIMSELDQWIPKVNRRHREAAKLYNGESWYAGKNYKEVRKAGRR